MPSVAHIVRRRQARKARRDAQRRRSSIWMLAAAIAALTLVIAPLAATVGLAAWLYARAANHFPPPAKTLYLDPIIGVTRLLDRSGNTLIYAIEDALGSQRRWLELEDLPQYAIDAALLAEDPDYLTTANFDAIHTLSQLWRYILGLPIKTESSITAKLARNAMLPLARSSGLDESLLEIALTAESHRLPMSTTWAVQAKEPMTRPPLNTGVTTVRSCRCPQVSHGSLVIRTSPSRRLSFG